MNSQTSCTHIARRIAGFDSFQLWHPLYCRFGCVWDRRSEENVPLDERMKPYVLRYYLVDDTVQITDAEFETNQRRGLYNSSRAQEAVLLRRQRLPKGLLCPPSRSLISSIRVAR